MYITRCAPTLWRRLDNLLDIRKGTFLSTKNSSYIKIVLENGAPDKSSSVARTLRRRCDDAVDDRIIVDTDRTI